MSANVLDFGSIQAALDSLKDPMPGWPDESGGEVFFPRGPYRVKEPIKFEFGNVTLRGEGGPGGEHQATHLINASDGPMFIFPHDIGRINDICFRDMNLIGNRSGEDTAFELWSGSKFRRSYTWDRVGAYRFGKVIATRREGRLRWIGDLQITGCKFELNKQALDAVETRINGLSIIGSNIRQNSPEDGVATIELNHANSVAIQRNCLEGNLDLLRFTGGDTLSFDNTYLEEQGGFVLLAEHANRIVIGPNFYRLLPLDNRGIGKIRLKSCEDVQWPGWDRERYIFEDCINVTPNPTLR